MAYVSAFASFDLAALAAEFPATADTMLLDRYLADTPEASTRIFRVYRPVPPHLHRACDEQLLVLQGRGRFWAATPQQTVEFGPGTLLLFPRGTVHAMPAMGEGPVVFLAMDTPRRDPADVHFINSTDGTAAEFIRAL